MMSRKHMCVQTTSLVMCVLAAILVLLMTSPQPANGKSVGKMMPPKCKMCNYVAAAKTMKMAAVCSACGEMYGWEFQHCCLCNYAIFDTCKESVMGIGGFE